MLHSLLRHLKELMEIYTTLNPGIQMLIPLFAMIAFIAACVSCNYTIEKALHYYAVIIHGWPPPLRTGPTISGRPTIVSNQPTIPNRPFLAPPFDAAPFNLDAGNQNPLV